MLNIENLHAEIANGPEIIKGLNLSIEPGSVHAIMGPNGSGKTSLSNILAGNPDYTITKGTIKFMDGDLTEMTPEERVVAGIFMAFQYPVSLPGVTTLNFLQTTLNHIQKKRQQPLMDAYDVIAKAEAAAKSVGLDPSMLSRALNEGFSGGEKKRNEILQLLLIQPKFVILDETDSGLDIDALKMIATAINGMRASDRSFLIITHYQRLLDHIKPDKIHVMSDGCIQQSGGPELAKQLEQRGYTNQNSERD